MPTIVSNPDPADPRPWFRFTFDKTAMTVTVAEANGVRAASRGRVTPQKEAALRRRHSVALSTEQRQPDENPSLPPLEEEVHVLAVTLDGDLEFVPQSRQRALYYAHLGWYDPTTGEATLLDFVEG